MVEHRRPPPLAGSLRSDRLKTAAASGKHNRLAELPEPIAKPRTKPRPNPAAKTDQPDVEPLKMHPPPAPKQSPKVWWPWIGGLTLGGGALIVFILMMSGGRLPFDDKFGLDSAWDNLKHKVGNDPLQDAEKPQRLTMQIVVNTEALAKYYEEHPESSPPELRPNPDEAPVAAQELERLASLAPIPKEQANKPPPLARPAPLETATWQRLSLARPELAGALNQAWVALIIDDMGLNHKDLELFLNLPPEVTLSWLPYADNLPNMVAAARQKGHEAMLHLPMEPFSKDANPGQNALLTHLPWEANRQRLAWNLARFDGYVGVNNHMGSDFTTNAETLGNVLSSIKDRGLLFIDSVTSSQTKAFQLAHDLDMPYGVRDVFLDNDRNESAIYRQLKATEATAKRKGYAIAIGHPYPETALAIQQWAKELASHNIRLVPITALVKRRENAY